MVAEASGCMNEEALRVFVHNWSGAFSTYNWAEWCTLPSDGKELGTVMKIFERVGFPGCIGSMDVVHIAWEKCPATLRALHVGKEGLAPRRKQILLWVWHFGRQSGNTGSDQ